MKRHKTDPKFKLGAKRRSRAFLPHEELERRDLLAVISVTSTAPDLTGTTTGSLNWAIDQANKDTVPDTIIFASSLTPDATTGLVTINAKWLHRVRTPIAFDGFDAGGGVFRSSATIVLNGPKDTSPVGYDIGSSILDFLQNADGSSVNGINFLNNGGAGITAQNVNAISVTNSYFGYSAIGAVKGANGGGIVYANVNNGVIKNNSLIYNLGFAINVSGSNNQVTGNTIRNNGGGIFVGGTGSGNTISGNAIYANGGKGITVGANANSGVAAPVLTNATYRVTGFFSARTLTISGELRNQTPNTQYKIQFFDSPANSVLDPIYPQGRYYFQGDDLTVTTDAAGNASFSKPIDAFLASFLVGVSIQLGDYVTATATRVSDGSSSEFSAPQTVVRELISDTSVSIKASPNPVLVGDVLEYTINVNNTGPDAAQNVVLTDQLDSNFTFVDASTTQGSVSVDASNKLVATLGAVDAVRTAQIIVRVRAGQTGVVSNTATITTTTYDTDPTNNSATTDVTVNPAPRADLALAGSFFPVVVNLGADSVYTVKVTNNGPDIARNSTMKTQLGNNVSFVSATNDHGTVTFDPVTRMLYSTLGNIEAAGSATIAIVVHADQIGTSTFTSTASTTSVETAPSTDSISTDLTIVDVPGKIQFPKMSFTVNEAVDPVFVPIQINRVQGTLGEATVLFSTQDGTAIAGIDYVGITDQLVTFPAGDPSPQYVNVEILPTSQWFLQRTFKVVLTDATEASLGSPTTAAVNILDQQEAPVGTIKLLSVTPNPVDETGGSVTVTVERTDGVSKALAVNYATANGTAIAGTNYTTTTGTLNWADGEMGIKSFKVPILQDGVYGPSLNFDVNLTAGNTDTTFTGPTTSSVTILNTTQKSNVAFNPVTYQVLENAGLVTLTVTRTALPLDQGGTGSIPAMSVAYATANGTATAGVDYTSTSGTLSWAAGDVSSKTITVGIIDNSQITLDRSFTVNLTGSSPNFVITQSTGTVVIKNNDIDNDGPVVNTMQLAGGTASSFNQIVLNFNEALDPTTAANAANYSVTVANTGAKIAVSSVQYLAGSNAVLVNLPANATKANVFYIIYVNANSPSGVQDVYGNMMNGNGNGNGSTFVNSMARGNSIFYNDNMGNRVTVGLQGGYFNLTRYQNGSGRDLAVYNTTKSSVLSGTVAKLNSSSSGYTRFDTLSGVGVPFNFKVTMTTPPFYFTTILATNPPLPTGAALTAARFSAARFAARKLAARRFR